MGDTQEQHLFEIKINETGKTYIGKFARLATPILILLATVSIAQLWLLIRSLWHLMSVGGGLSNYLVAEFLVSIALVIVNVASLTYFTSFARKLRESIDTNDEELFNFSFSLIYRNAIVVITAVILTMASVSFNTVMLYINHQL